VILNLGGTIRSCSAEETLNRLKPLLPLFGITRVASQESLSEIQIPVSFCFRPNGKCLSTGQGKGLTRELADISAIMESIELFHAERIPPPAIFASVNDLAAAQKKFISPLELHPSKLRSLFSAEEKIGWLTFKNLTDNADILVPHKFIDMDKTAPKTEISSLCMTTSGNGLASGNTLEEAILHGLYELVERHCNYNFNFSNEPKNTEGKTLDLNSVLHIPHIAQLLTALTKANYKVKVRALHNSMNIPVFEAAISENEVLSRGTFEHKGFGCHYSAEVALSRAIAEAVQSRVTIITASRDDIYPWLYRYQELVSVTSASENSGLVWDDIPKSPEFESHQQALKWTLEILNSHGFNRACFFNHQREEFGNIPVVSVVCPGLKGVPIDDQ